MTEVPADRTQDITITSDTGHEVDATDVAVRYIALRLRAVASHRAWVETGDANHLRKRDELIFRSIEIVTTIRDLMGHEVSKRFAHDAHQAFGPVNFWS